MPTIAPWCFSTQAFHAAIPSLSFARRSASGRASHAFLRGLVLLPRKIARYVLFMLMTFPFLYVLQVETEARCARAITNSFVAARSRRHLLRGLESNRVRQRGEL